MSDITIDNSCPLLEPFCSFLKPITQAFAHLVFLKRNLWHIDIDFRCTVRFRFSTTYYNIYKETEL